MCHCSSLYYYGSLSERNIIYKRDEKTEKKYNILIQSYFKTGYIVVSVQFRDYSILVFCPPLQLTAFVLLSYHEYACVCTVRWFDFYAVFGRELSHCVPANGPFNHVFGSRGDWSIYGEAENTPGYWLRRRVLRRRLCTFEPRPSQFSSLLTYYHKCETLDGCEDGCLLLNDVNTAEQILMEFGTELDYSLASSHRLYNPGSMFPLGKSVIWAGKTFGRSKLTYIYWICVTHRVSDIKGGIVTLNSSGQSEYNWL